MISGREMLVRNLFMVHTHLGQCGEYVVTLPHKRNGHIYISAGCLLIENADTNLTMAAPEIFFIAPGVRYRLMAKSNDTVFTCVHYLEDGEHRPPLME